VSPPVWFRVHIRLRLPGAASAVLRGDAASPKLLLLLLLLRRQRQPWHLPLLLRWQPRLRYLLLRLLLLLGWHRPERRLLCVLRRRAKLRQLEAPGRLRLPLRERRAP
jgi:hypothetical protein